MKTFTKILTAAAATALLATGCVNEDPAYKNNEPGTPPDPNAKGYLTLADMSMRVVVDTDTETRPDDTSDETAKPQTRTDEAQPDVDTFIIEIRDATGKLALQETYGDLKASIGEAGRLELPVGGYTMEVRSEEAATTPAAEWEHPVYFGSQEFVIEKNQTTPINEVVCTLNNIKVTLMCSKDLADQLTADTKSTVTLGETTMTFLKDETRAAYFMPQGETNTLKLHLEGAFADTPDAPVRINKSISGVKAGQWRKLSIVITYSDKGDIKLDIDVNDFMEDDEIPVNDPDNPGEPGLPVAPTLECPGYDLTKPFQLLASMFDAQGNYTRPFAFNLASSNGIGSFAVKITSDNSRLAGMVSGIGGPEFDLCTIGASDPAYTVLAGFGPRGRNPHFERTRVARVGAPGRLFRAGGRQRGAEQQGGGNVFFHNSSALIRRYVILQGLGRAETVVLRHREYEIVVAGEACQQSGEHLVDLEPNGRFVLDCVLDGESEG